MNTEPHLFQQKLFSFTASNPFYINFLDEVARFKKQCESFGITGEDLVVLVEEPSSDVKRKSSYDSIEAQLSVRI